MKLAPWVQAMLKNKKQGEMKYHVTIRKTEVYQMTVDSDSEENAINKGESLIESEAGRAMYHNDSEFSAEAHED